MVYAAMAATYGFDYSIGTNINLGVFDQEVSLLVDASASRNVKMFGGTTSPQALAALYPALEDDRLVMGEEIFTGGAEVTGRSVFGGSLWAQNILRWLVVAGIIVAAIVSMLGLGG
jgi:acyl-CoA thioesterase